MSINININVNYLLDNNILESNASIDYNRISLVESNLIADAIWNDNIAIILQNKMEIARIILQNKIITDPNTGIMSIYADDNTTILFTVELFEDINESKPYSGAGADVRYNIS